MSKSSVCQLAEVFERRAVYAKAVVAQFPDAMCDTTPGEDKYESNQVKDHPDRKAEYFAESFGPVGKATGIAVRWYVEIKPRKLPPVRVYDRTVSCISLDKVADMLNERKVIRADEQLRKSA